MQLKIYVITTGLQQESKYVASTKDFLSNKQDNQLF